MALTARAPLLALAAVLVVFAVPAHGVTVAYAAVALLLVVIADLALACSPRALALSRDGATSTRLGEPADIGLVVGNPTGRQFRGWVRDAWAPSAAAEPRLHRVELRPGARRRLVTTLRPQRRGNRPAAAVTVRSAGPLGVAARQRTRTVPWSVQVLPPFTSRKFLPEKLARLRELDGAVVAAVRGQGTEFDSLRDYVSGDDPRSIDWRASARRVDIAVRTWRPERDRQLLLVLDTGRTSAARVGDAPRLDAAIDAALLLTAVARRAGDRVALLAHDRSLRAVVDAGRDGDSLAAVVRAVAPVHPQLVETDMRAVVNQTLIRSRHRALVVLFTSIDPAVVREGLLPSLGPLLHRHVVVIANVADPALEQMRLDRTDAAAVYSAAAAEAADNDRRAMTWTLRRRGVVVSEAPPETFASHVVDTYLDLKAAGKL